MAIFAMGDGLHPTDAVEKLGFFSKQKNVRKIDLHNRSVLSDCLLGNNKAPPINKLQSRFLSFSTKSTHPGRSRQRWFNGRYLNGVVV